MENQPFDISQFKEQDSSLLTKQSAAYTETAKSVFMNNSSERIPFHDILPAPAANIRRQFPAHPKTGTALAEKCVHWLPQLVWLDTKNNNKEVYQPKDEDVEKVQEFNKKIQTGEYTKGIKRKPIFNSRIHSGIWKSEKNPKGIEGVSVKGKMCRDIVEAYIVYATEEVLETLGDIDDKKLKEKKLEEKLSPILDWKLGIRPQVSFIMYANAYKADGSKLFGKQEISDNIRQLLNVICTRTEGNSPIIKDFLSGPKSGKKFNINYDKENKDNKKKYSCTLIFDEDCPLTEDELKAFMNVPSLEELFVNSYKKSDFMKEVQGLQAFDAGENMKKTVLNYFAHSEFQDIIVKFDSLFSNLEDKKEVKIQTVENNVTYTVKAVQIQQPGVTTPPVERTESISQQPTQSSANPFKKMDRATLVSFIAFSKLDIQPKDRHDADRIADDIFDELKSTKFANVAEGKMVREMGDMIEDFYEANNPNTQGPVAAESIVDTSKNSTEGLSRLEEMKRKFSGS